jgi:nitrogen fixation protein FixH
MDPARARPIISVDHEGRSMMEQRAHPEKLPKKITGRFVLVCLVAFFATVAGVNGVLVKAAISTFGGVEVDSSYRAGLVYDREIKAAHAQEALHWRVAGKVSSGKGITVVEVSVFDAGGQPISGLDINVTLAHPTDRRHDHRVAVQEDAPGRFRGVASDVAPGGWDLVLELSRAGERMFLSRNRVGVR